MLDEGMIAIYQQGFDIYLKSERKQQFSIDDLGNFPKLIARQRFTIAHELVHTFFFQTNSAGVPFVKKDVQDGEVFITGKFGDREIAFNLDEIEYLCQEGARFILMPDRMMKEEIRSFNQDWWETIQGGLARFGISPDVYIRQIDTHYNEAVEKGKDLVVVRHGRHLQQHTAVGKLFRSSFLPGIELFSGIDEWWSHLFGCKYTPNEYPGMVVLGNRYSMFVERKDLTDECYILSITPKGEVLEG